jgi:hypothetical protein
MRGVDVRNVTAEVDRRGKLLDDALLDGLAFTLSLGVRVPFAFDEWSDIRKFTWLLFKARYFKLGDDGKLRIHSSISDVIKVLLFNYAGLVVV